MVGSGGREHALSWKLSQSDKVQTVYTAPGNGGTQNNVSLDVSDLDGLADFAQKNVSNFSEFFDLRNRYVPLMLRLFFIQ